MKSIINFFYFNKNERRALFAFLIVLIVVKSTYQLYKENYQNVNYEFLDSSNSWIDTTSVVGKVNLSRKVVSKKKNPQVHFKKYTSLIVDVNTADSTEFRKLRGIGQVYSSRIVRYRNWLGGFHVKEQLLEVYGIDSALFLAIEPNLVITTSSINKININLCTSQTLSSHPYISKKIARSIVKYREHHGDYKSLNDLKLIPLIDEELLRKIAFYLALE